MEMTWLEQISLLRRRKGLTQNELADSIGISRGTMNTILSGKGSPRIEQLQAIATELGGVVSISIDLSASE